MEEAEVQRLQGFLKWAAELGISDSPSKTLQSQSPNSCLGYSLAVSHFPDAGGRGLGAVRDLKKGELVLRVPKTALLTRDSLMEDDEILKFAVNSHPSLSPSQILTVCLLYEVGKGKSSRWYSYLSHLPRNYDILATFSEFEKQALQVDDAVWTAEKAVSNAELEWKEAHSLMEELKLKPQLLAFKAWIWAAATISSRTLHIPWDKAGCLCPVGDLFNYSAPGEELTGSDASPSQDCSLLKRDVTDNSVAEQLDPNLQRLTDGGFDEDTAAYCFYARKNYKKGEQVLLCYGTYTNLELLEHYGFLLPENPSDKVFIPLESNMYSSNSWPRDSLFINRNGKPSFALLSALRLWATPLNQRRSIGHLVYSGCQLSVQNEMFVMKWLSKNCSLILHSFPTTGEEDRLLLSTIDKIQGFHECTELGNEFSSFENEVCTFLEANRVQQRGKVGAEMLLSNKTKRSIERWKLAVEWRYRHKKILTECVSYCTEIVSSLSSPIVLINQ